jgi:small subunit ribosomal protein S8
MSLTDPVADLLARIRNAIPARHQKLDVPASTLKLELARILKEEGYIANF